MDKKEASFKLTEQSYEKLKKDGLPEDLLNQLKSLKDQLYTVETDFVEAIEKAIGAEQTGKCKLTILKSANKTLDKRLEIVILDDNKDIIQGLLLKLLKDGHPEEKIKTFSKADDFLSYMQDAKVINVAILDKNLEGGIKVQDKILPNLVQKFGPLIAIIITAFPDPDEETYARDVGARKIIHKVSKLGMDEDLYPKILETIIKYQEFILALDITL